MTSTNKARLIATSVITLTLIAAAPVFADSNSERSEHGLRLGVIADLFEGNREDRMEARKEKIAEHKSEQKDTSVSATNHFTIDGTVTFVSGDVITLSGKHGAVYTVQAGNATVVGDNNATLSLSSIAVNDRVKVTGTLSGNVVVATKIKEKSHDTRKMFRAVSAGIVTAINGTSVVLDKFGSSGTSTVNVSSGTKYKVNGQATTSSALQVGSHVIVAGSTTVSGGTINASVVHILTEGFNWLKHFFR